MAGLFSKPSKPKPPPVPPPAAIPQVSPEVEDFAMRQARRRKGFSSTIITGHLAPSGGGKTALG